MSSGSLSTIRVPFNEKLQKLVATAWNEVKADALSTPIPTDRPISRFVLSETCKLVIDWVFAEATKGGDISRESLSKSYGYIIHRRSVITKTPTIFIPLHIMPEVSIRIDDASVSEGFYYKVLKQDVIDISGEGRVFGLVMFEGTV